MTLTFEPKPTVAPELTEIILAATPASRVVHEQIEPVSSPRRLRLLLGAWLAAVVIGNALVIYGFGPFFQERAQRGLLRDYRAAIVRATNEATGLPGVAVPTRAPERGSSLGILEMGSIELQQVVLEGVGASETQKGPGHVPGTAGLGQPGNSVIVGRHAAFGGPFARLRSLHTGDKIVITTTQGQSVYEVSTVERRSIRASELDSIYGPTKDDRLTVVTSGSTVPWNKSAAIVAVATLRTQPFAPTPQGGRTDSNSGVTGDDGATASVILALAAYGATLAASVVLYRRMPSRIAYLLSVGPVLAMTVIASETLSRLLPAWA